MSYRINDDLDGEELDFPNNQSFSSYHESFEGCNDDSGSEYDCRDFLPPDEFLGSEKGQLNNAKRVGKLYPLIGRLEHISLKDDFQLILRSHPDVVIPFMERVGEELVKCVEEHPTRSGVREIVDVFFYVKNDLENVPFKFFNDPIIAWAMDVIFAVCNYLVKAECVKGNLPVVRNGHTTSMKRNYASIQELVASAAILTFGKSVFGSLAVSMAETKDELPRTTAEMYVVAYDVGFAHRMVSRSLFRCEPCESFNLFVVGISTGVLEMLLSKLNEGLWYDGELQRPFSHLELTLVLGTRSVVVSGYSTDIAKLKLALRAFSESKGVRLYFSEIMLSCPQNHQTLNERVYRELLARWEHEGVHLDSSRLKCTVLSPATGEPWNASSWAPNSDCFQKEVALTVTCSRHVLKNALQKVSKDDRLTCIGGGAFGVEQLLDWEKGGLASMAVQPILFPLKQQTSDIGVRQTLKKMATINEAWNNAFPERRKILSTTSSLLESQLDSHSNHYHSNHSRADEDNAFFVSCPCENSDEDEPLSRDVLSACSRCQNETRDLNILISPRMEKFFEKVNLHIKVDPRRFRFVTNVSMLLELWDAADFLDEE